MLMRPVNASSSGFSPSWSMAGNHQYAITDIAVDIHLLVDERHAFVVQQVYLVEHNNRLNLQGFAGHRGNGR